MTSRINIIIILGLLIAITVYANWRTPITDYQPKTADERALVKLFIEYVTSRNSRDVTRFLSTLHDDCRYMVTRDKIVTKKQLRAMLPALWMQNDDNNAAFGRCMAWECWHENYYRTIMLINPRFKISNDRAQVDFKVVSGLFMDDNYFRVVKANHTWLIARFSRPIN